MKFSEKIKANRLAIVKIVEINNTLYPRIIRNDLKDYELDNLHLGIVVDRTSEFTPADIGNIQQQLEALLDASVDVFTPNLLPDNLRERILSEAVVI
jgi:uncharacterized protein